MLERNSGKVWSVDVGDVLLHGSRRQTRDSGHDRTNSISQLYSLTSLYGDCVSGARSNLK